ncbi:unnamed protein product [Microthlaspi erraticum]|uniref:RNase H type-1 domain-containing protein n=1 Tax=Microthlaspi erraticum TaxID=1685480 RepID=A0A6D2HGP6_9BRAS|nr:unnamed protein product [Microthlaspi erraticum]
MTFEKIDVMLIFKDMGGYAWSTLFAMSCWWGWKWRCWYVFGKTGLCQDRVKFVKDLAKDVSMAHEKSKAKTGTRARTEQQIAWEPLEGGWLKMNTDGASKGNPGAAAAGGVLSDEVGAWVCGFSLNLGICSAPLAELWGVYYGLYLAWEKRVSRLEIEVDSEMVAGFFKTWINESHPLSFLVRLCYGFISRDWIVRVTHVYREANCVVDALANHAFSLPFGFFSFTSTPAEISALLLGDVNGSTRVRFVRS